MPTSTTGAPAWTTSSTLDEIASWLRGGRQIVVLTHQKPDGDAVGSTLGAVRALNAAAQMTVAQAWYTGPVPAWLPWLAGTTPFRVLNQENGQAVPPPIEPDRVLITDTGSWSQLDLLREWLGPMRPHAAVIDHHVQGDGDVAPRRHIDTAASAVCQPVAALCVKLLGVRSAAELPQAVATPLYLGLATDTGWFKHSNVTPDLLSLASELLRAGANSYELFQATEQRDKPGRIRLLAKALSSMELFESDQVAVMGLTRADFHAAGAEPQDTGGFVDTPATIERVKVVCLLTEGEEQGQTVTKVSMRSKGGSGPTGVDVNEAARKLGGGGHVRAAGARVRASLAETKRRVLEILKEQL